jgi:hypothetical protein
MGTGWRLTFKKREIKKMRNLLYKGGKVREAKTQVINGVEALESQWSVQKLQTGRSAI